MAMPGATLIRPLATFSRQREKGFEHMLAKNAEA
jgi:hypothetical protein